MRSLIRPLAVLALIATTTLAGCSSSSDSSDGDKKSSSDDSASAPGFDAEPADGKTISGQGYSYKVPDGWATPDQDIKGTEQTDSLAADLKDDDGFSDNVNVVRQDPAPGKFTDDLEDTLSQQLEGAGATNVKARDRVDIDGEESLNITGSQELNGNKYLTNQYYTIHDGALYVTTFSYSTDVSSADQDKVAGSVLATWKWAA